MKPNLIKIFKYIEDKIGKKLNSEQSFRLKLFHDPSSMTKEELDIKGDLDLGSSKIQSLPNDLTVGGNLNLSYTKIKSLPNGLTVGKSLNLSGSKIESLPNGLRVRGSLYLRYSIIESLPNDLTVGGYLDLENTPISKKYTKEEIRKMVPNVKGSIYI